MIILGIETTCDETSVGLVENGKKVLSNVVSSSSELHKKFGGIVPEVAAREQVRLIVPVISQAVSEANLKLSDVDAVAVANGPGLIGSLLIGTEAAKTLAHTLGKRLISVNHLVGHVYANWIGDVSAIKFPLVALIVSGGHTDLALMEGVGKFRLLGSTRDDSAGEVFDKVARVLGLGYPGGPEIERVAENHKQGAGNYKFPRPMIGEGNFDFSFSGLKTAVVNLAGKDKLEQENISGIAFEFQEAVVEVLVKKTISAALKFNVKTIVVGGGVSANGRLRKMLGESGGKIGISVLFPQKNLSVDNGAMIASAAYFEQTTADPLKLQANPSLHF